MSDNAPENCLFGFKCPACGQREKFFIEGTVEGSRPVWVTMTDDGTEELFLGPFEFDDNNQCRCPKCNWSGAVGDARKGA